MFYNIASRSAAAVPSEPEQEEPLALVKRKVENENDEEEEEDDVFIKQEQGGDDGFSAGASAPGSGKAKQRNYKNMTRERRIEANARERQRVHTITAAFDRLQVCVSSIKYSRDSFYSREEVIWLISERLCRSVISPLLRSFQHFKTQKHISRSCDCSLRPLSVL